MRTVQYYDPYDVNCEFKHHALIYLAEVKKETNNFIAELLGYAISTVRIYRKKYAYLLIESKKLFDIHIIQDEDYIVNPNNYDLDIRGKFFYLIKFYDRNGNFLVSKIGTTERTLRERLKEHFKSNTPYSRIGATSLTINKVFQCKKDPRGIENYFRGLLMLQYELSGNDQFYYDLDWENFEEKIQKYLEKGG